jgi:hypothetical protein
MDSCSCRMNTLFVSTPCWKQIRNEKVMAPKNKGGQELKKKNKTSNITKASFQTPQIVLVCCSVTIRSQGWFVKLQMAFLEYFKSFEMNKK